jgi:YggT family protein
VACSGIGAIAALRLMRLTVYIVMVAVIAQAILSWISPYHQLAPLLNSMTAPFLRRFQRIIPPIGNVDLSPLFVIIVCQLVLMLPIAWLEMSAVQLL